VTKKKRNKKKRTARNRPVDPVAAERSAAQAAARALNHAGEPADSNHDARAGEPPAPTSAAPPAQPDLPSQAVPPDAGDASAANEARAESSSDAMPSEKNEAGPQQNHEKGLENDLSEPAQQSDFAADSSGGAAGASVPNPSDPESEVLEGASRSPKKPARKKPVRAAKRKAAARPGSDPQGTDLAPSQKPPEKPPEKLPDDSSQESHSSNGEPRGAGASDPGLKHAADYIDEVVAADGPANDAAEKSAAVSGDAAEPGDGLSEADGASTSDADAAPTNNTAQNTSDEETDEAIEGSPDQDRGQNVSPVDALSEASGGDPTGGERPESEASDPAGPAASNGAADNEEAERTLCILESLLFATDKPLGLSDIKRALGDRRDKDIKAALETLMKRRSNSGIRVVTTAGGWRLQTAPENDQYVLKLVQGRPVRLSRALMETLAIIAYKQPATRPEIDDIRGVDSGPVLKTLLDRQLIRVIGKKEEVGRPLLYGTTPEFLKTFNLKDLTELPTLREFHDLASDKNVSNAGKPGRQTATENATDSDASAAEQGGPAAVARGPFAGAAAEPSSPRPDALANAPSGADPRGTVPAGRDDDEDALLEELERATAAVGDVMDRSKRQEEEKQEKEKHDEKQHDEKETEQQAPEQQAAVSQSAVPNAPDVTGSNDGTKNAPDGDASVNKPGGPA